VGNRHDALSIEWKIKHCKRKTDGVGIPGKIAAACRFGEMVTRLTISPKRQAAHLWTVTNQWTASRNPLILYILTVTMGSG